MNKVILMGRLTKDPTVSYSNNANGQMAIARYSLAVDRRSKTEGGQNADFINIVAFGKAGEFAEKYLHKGTKVVVSGRIQSGSYTDKDGKTVYTTDVVAEDQEFAESKSANATSTSNNFTPNFSAPIGGDLPLPNANPMNGFSPMTSEVPSFLNVPEGTDGMLPFAVSR